MPALGRAGNTRGRAFRRDGPIRCLCGLCASKGSVRGGRIRSLQLLREQMRRRADVKATSSRGAVCWKDVWNALRPGDLVVFFAADRLADHCPDPTRYVFVGFATVARKV